MAKADAQAKAPNTAKGNAMAKADLVLSARIHGHVLLRSCERPQQVREMAQQRAFLVAVAQMSAVAPGLRQGQEDIKKEAMGLMWPRKACI